MTKKPRISIQLFLKFLYEVYLIEFFGSLAAHNQWLFDQPRTMYIHWFSIEPPLVFARKVAEAFRVLQP
jgi:hypothetical protein